MVCPDPKTPPRGYGPVRVVRPFPCENAPMPAWLIIVIIAAGLACSAYALHRLALWAESRGWLYYRQKARFRGSSIGLIEEIYNPAAEHVFEERSGERARGDTAERGSGDPPPDEV